MKARLPRNPKGSPAAFVLAAGLGLLFAASGQAVQLDKLILAKPERRLHELHAKGYHNIGVLPFAVQKGARKSSFEAAPLCNNLPTRLENALIMSQDPKGQIIGIIRNAAGQARAAGAESYRENEKDFQKL